MVGFLIRLQTLEVLTGMHMQSSKMKADSMLPAAPSMELPAGCFCWMQVAEQGSPRLLQQLTQMLL